MAEPLIKNSITTSWDDGHPLDFRVADLLEKYGMRGTFYIPQTNLQNPVMKEQDIAVLSRRHEIGGHTLHHVNLLKIDQQKTKMEISGCYHWLTDLTGAPVYSFCPPFGAYNDAVVSDIKQAGFRFIRGTQLLTTANRYPVNQTTLQVYEHSSFTYFKHLAIRSRITDLAYWLSLGPTSDLLKLANRYLEQIEKQGGTFHLWGHSWEIERYGLWKQLEALLLHLANRPGYDYVENKGLIITAATNI